MKELEKAIQLRESGQLEEARCLLLELLNKEPMNPSVWYQCAWIHDVMELEREALPYYKKSLELGLSDEERQGAYLGLGSTYRTLGMYDDAKLILEEAIEEFPNRREFQVFYAMVRFNQKAYSESMEILLKQIAETSNDKGIQTYKKAILFYSDKLDQTWD
ncbi:Tetratrico peptide repeat-containing protein [Paenibacillus tianmuensis]|uniref:Tetratrico peptide repeat-containing protein n=1 Tax=Paenibacillus tianmuensis TaxID=624147 RepID=A0A1G4T6M6_9BACL|nr:tetratricopeptide repeat protein [Paenibacillus tianmuensis]SCW76926.1 Tetratrico peptide repeat-containing protein [Paenibacillus tianmuensis]